MQHQRQAFTKDVRGLPLAKNGSSNVPDQYQQQGRLRHRCNPIAEDGAIDSASVDSVTDFYLETGADGLTILGMMGEAPKLTYTEALAVTRQTLARAAGKPVVVGVSAPGLAAISELTKAVMDLGAAGVMVAPPGNLKTNEQIISYYQQIVDALGSDVPVVLQDFPLSTGVSISNDSLGRIIETCPSIVMIKHEDWPGLAKDHCAPRSRSQWPPPRLDSLR